MLELLWQWHLSFCQPWGHIGMRLTTDERIEPNNSCNFKLCGWVCDSGASYTFSVEICDVWTTNVTGEFSNHLLLLGFISCWTCAKVSGAPVSKEQCSATQQKNVFVGICIFLCKCLRSPINYLFIFGVENDMECCRIYVEMAWTWPH